ncbi:MAG: EscC/YscC/HrcC family type III secretion system outer membrane ring protein [Plesiomonas sp.]
MITMNAFSFRAFSFQVMLLVSVSTYTFSATPTWNGKPFFIYGRDANLTCLLNDFSANYGLAAVVSPTINDVFSGNIKYLSASKTLSELSERYHLAWYFYNGTIYFYKANELSQKVIPFDAVNTSILIKYIDDAGLIDKRYCRVKALNHLSSLAISGVPICIDQVSALVQQFNLQSQEKSDKQEGINIFPLQYASAGDYDYQYRDTKVRLPGLVSVLREMSIGNHSVSNDTASNTESLPLFSADQQRNAIIVRDKLKNMPLYRGLIKQLDIRPVQIEISVTIIDVNASDINQLGIDWSASAALGGGKIDFNSGLNDSGNAFSTVIGNTGGFMIRLKALEQNSKAKVLSQPSVVTLNNIQAILDKSVTFYTKLQSDNVAKLESVVSGSLLRVTPRLINDSGRKNILLNLNIQDGQQRQTAGSTDGLPEVDNSDISTQATLKAGQSLLLGGFIQNKQSNSVNKIPLLGDIPVIGSLFRSKKTEVTSVVRLFLIKAIPVEQEK